MGKDGLCLVKILRRIKRNQVILWAEGEIPEGLPRSGHSA